MPENIPNLGFEYEVHLPAYFALVLNNNPDIEDFSLQSNVEEFGNLDDLLVQIRKKNGEELHFAFQLKHKKDGHKHLLPSNLEAKGDFNIEKYCLAFKNLKEKNKKYNFILFTNKHFDASRVEEVANFKMKMDDRCPGRIFFDTSQDCEALYKFEVSDATEDGKCVTKEDYGEFFSKFTLYTGQANFNDLDRNFLLDVFEFKEPCLKYIDFFRRWHRKEFGNKILDKKTINIQLIDIFLAPFLLESVQLPDHFEQAVKEFDITIVEDSSSDLFSKSEEIDVEDDKLIRLAKEWKIIDKSAKQIDNSVKLKILYYFFEKPMIVNFTDISKDLVYKAMDMFKLEENKIKFVFVGSGIETEKFSGLKIFENLQRLSEANSSLYDHIVKNCFLLFQGRYKKSLKKLIKNNRNISEFTKPDDLLQMFCGNYSVGGNKEVLPLHYIPRTVSTKIQNLKLVLHRCVEMKDLIILKFENKNNFIPVKEVTLLSVQEFLERRQISNSAVVLTTDEDLSHSLFDKICDKHYKKYKKLLSNSSNSEQLAVHYFRILNEEDLLLVMSTNNVFQTPNPNLKKLSMDEDRIDIYLQNPINFVISSPGMGKSSLFKSLKNDNSSNWWTFYMDLKIHNNFLKKKPNAEQLLNYLKKLEETVNTNSFTKQLLNIFLEEKKVVIFFDGLDEIESDSITTVLDFTKELSSMGHRVWISSRHNLKQRLEETFNIFALEIEELNQEQQKLYIQNRLQSKYKQEEIEEIIGKIFRNVDICNSGQILGIPLQLFIITQIFLDDTEIFQREENVFVLTKMYRLFIEGRYKHVIDKVVSQNHQLLPFDLEDFLERYELVALHSLFSEEILRRIDFDARKNRRILTKMKKEKDPLGIVLEVNSEDKAVFEHVTFAEYFVCTFLVNNYSIAKQLQRCLFSEKYENLLRMLNIMLAEESKLHLAVIYKDLDLIRTNINVENASTVDKGGRNLLHIISCNSKRYPRLEVSINEESFEVDDLPVKNFERESSVTLEIFNLLLAWNVNRIEYDQVFGFDPMTYALAFGALHIAENLYTRILHLSNFCYHNDTNIVYYSLRFGYPNLLKYVLSITPRLVLNKITCKSLSVCWQNSIIRFVVMAECAKKTEVLDLITNNQKTRPTKAWKPLKNNSGYRTLKFRRTMSNAKTELVDDVFEFLGAGIKDQTREQKFSFWRKNSEKNSFARPYSMKATPLVHKTSSEGSLLSLFLERNSNKTPIETNWLPPETEVTDIQMLFYYAAMEGKTKILKELLKQVSKDQQIKNIALFPAIENHQNDVVALLLAEKASVKCTAGPLEETPLHLSTRVGNIIITDMLLENKASLKAKRKDGLNVLNSTIFEKQWFVKEFLVEKGAKYDHQSLFAAAYAGNLQLLKHLVKKIGKINKRNELGEHILHYIFKNGDVKVDTVSFLLQNGASVEERGRHGWTILHYAVMSGRVEIVELLLKKYNLVEFLYVVDEEGVTPLHLAVQQGDVEIVELILGQEIDLEKIKFDEKITSLYLATIEGCLTRDLLLQVTNEIRDMLD